MRTTISLHVNTIKKISQLAKQRGLFPREIITMSLNALFVNHKIIMESLEGGLVHYQKRDPSCYKRVHYSFDELSYKLAIDCRNLYRKSISSMIAQEIDEWGKVGQKVEEGKDVFSKCYSSFIINKYTSEDSVIWHCEWGVEERKEETIYSIAACSDP